MLRRKFKIEDYNKNEPLKDATKYFIIYEGLVKEPNYFEAFNQSFLDKKSVYIHHILEFDTGIIGNTPLKLMERAEAFIKTPPKDIKVTPSIDDKYRFVLDVDKHPRDQIDELKIYCDELNNANLFISNFCFEVWLWAHIEELHKISSTKSSELKTELGSLHRGNYPHYFMDINFIYKAIERCEDADINKTNFFPVEKSSKVYVLIKELLEHSFLNLEIQL